MQSNISHASLRNLSTNPRQALSVAIAAEDIAHIFAVVSDANQDIIVELCEKHGLKYVHAHHETAAGGMADGYSRFTGKIGLCATTQGPGYTNATRSLVGARLHRSPVFLLAGHALLRDPYNPQGMVDQHAMALLSAGATVKIDHPNMSITALGKRSASSRPAKGRLSSTCRRTSSTLPCRIELDVSPDVQGEDFAAASG